AAGAAERLQSTVARCVTPSGTRRLGNQTRAALAGEIRPQPLALHAQPVLQLRQRQDVNERPHEPREEAARVERASFQDRKVLADDRHVAFVEIAKRTLDWAAFELLRDQLTDVAPLLNRRLRDAWHGMLAVRDGRCIADDEHSIGHLEKWIDERPARAIGRR